MMKSPYPYFGGKRRVAHMIWDALGDVSNYVEPFLGSAAILLARPDEHKSGTETVNDKDGFISNFWRAVQSDAETVARYADWPVNENDLHARHAWLVSQRESMTARLEGDPAWYDAKIAGWWVWGMACWIGSGFCSGFGPWVIQDGQLVHLGNAGQGVNRQLVHLGNAGRGVNRQSNGLYAYFEQLQARLARVRVASGDWVRVIGPAVTTGHGLTGVVLDPPYVMDNRETLYTHDTDTIADDVRRWAIENGDNPLLRIVYCGYEDGYEWPAGWRVIEWQAIGGYKSGGKGNKQRERLWLSPGCVGATVERAEQMAMWR